VIEIRGGFWQPSSTPPAKDYLRSLVPTTTLTKSNAQIGFPNWSFQPLIPSDQQTLTAELAYPATEFVDINNYSHRTLLDLVQNNVGVKEHADMDLVPNAWIPDQQQRYRRDAVAYGRAYDEAAKRDEKKMWLADLAYYVRNGVNKLNKARMEIMRQQTLVARILHVLNLAQTDGDEGATDECEAAKVSMDGSYREDDLTESSFCCIGPYPAPSGCTPYPEFLSLTPSPAPSENYGGSSVFASSASTYRKQLQPELNFPKIPVYPRHVVGNLYMARQIVEFIVKANEAGKKKLIPDDLQAVRAEKRRWDIKWDVSPLADSEARDQKSCRVRRKKRVRRAPTPHPHAVEQDQSTQVASEEPTEYALSVETKEKNTQSESVWLKEAANCQLKVEDTSTKSICPAADFQQQQFHTI
jgi:hypothetical protein